MQVEELAKRLRALRWAMMAHGLPHEQTVDRYREALALQESEWGPASIDPAVQGSWHWWAKELLS